MERGEGAWEGDAIVGMHEVAQLGADEIVGGMLEDPCRRRTLVTDLPDAIEHRDEIGGAVHKRAEPRRPPLARRRSHAIANASSTDATPNTISTSTRR